MGSYTMEDVQAAIRRSERTPRFPLGAELTKAKLEERLRSEPMQPFLRELRAEAKHAAETPMPALAFSDAIRFAETGERQRYENLYFARRRRLFALAMAVLLDEDEAAIEPLQEALWDICNEASWVLPAHQEYAEGEGGRPGLPAPHTIDLFAAETGHALAEAVTLLGDRLHPWIRQRVREEVERRIFRPFAERTWWWETAEMNWSSVCAGGVGMAAMLLMDEPDELATVLARVLGAMDCFLAGYGDDGGCPEGVMYWEYGVGFYLYFAEMLYEYTGGELDLWSHLGEKGRNIAKFPMHVALTKDRYVNYSDSPERSPVQSGLADRLSRRVGVPVAPESDPISSFHHDHCYRWAHLTRCFFWSDPSAERSSAPDGSFFLRDLGWVVDRFSANGAVFAFSAKGGHNDEPHNHNDLGHFLLHAAGESLLPDLGKGIYSKAYFREERYGFLHPSSLGHSVPVVRGEPQSAGREFNAVVLRCESTEKGTDFALDLTQAYGAAAGLRSFVREFHWRRGDGECAAAAELTLRDTFRLKEAGEVREMFLSLHRPELTPGLARWAGENAAATMRYDPERFRAEVQEVACDGLPDGKKAAYRLCLTGHCAADAETSFEFAFAVSLA
ncbi:heparinase II/III-family protein [Paenibacillus sp. TRM 82003]|nr:heparinase II/III-family protein [Paenibacillus sp. TRM 82003]